MSSQKRIVVKVGSSLITAASGRLDDAKLEKLVAQTAKVRKHGDFIIIVTSGAIAAGMESLGIDKRPKDIPSLQAAASVGQGLLIERYSNLFDKYGVRVGQVLVTQFDTTHRQQYLNTRNTLNKLFELGVVPIVNENDTTAVDEIKFGENDTLAALVASLVGADLLILLSDIKGLCTTDPNLDENAEMICVVEEITDEIEALAGGAGSKFGSGGMITKIRAAKIATMSGVSMVIADGMREDVIVDAVAGREVGTLFKPSKKRLSARKLWIAFGKASKGVVVVDAGAKKAVIEGRKSLLPAGILSYTGKFSVGDAVDVADEEAKVFAKGLTNYASEEMDKIKGLRGREALGEISEGASDELIHRDCLVVF
ncbi:MAG: glutamate 5-kinase [Actinomycetota bacterium]|nr:glutamate 5-kinase [Actinomycetota bacterium]